jgi:hypothetical protein
MPFCANCGVSVNDGDGFCQNCGAARSFLRPSQVPLPPPPPSQYACQPPQTAQVIEQSTVVNVLPQAKIMTPMGPSDTYTIVFTPNQAIFAKLSGDILQSVVKKSQFQSKVDGKGWMGRARDQMRALGDAHTRYLEMTPGQILVETSGNFAIDHAAVAVVSVRIVYEPTNEDGPGDPYTEVEFDTGSSKYKYRLRMRAKDVVKLLNNFYHSRIKT